MWLSGLEDLVVDDVHNHLGLLFLNVGERCNISGSIRFKKLMMAGDFGTAMDIAKKQVEDGAHVIDINVDHQASPHRSRLHSHLASRRSNPHRNHHPSPAVSHLANH